jgi:hypothetical protein
MWPRTYPRLPKLDSNISRIGALIEIATSIAWIAAVPIDQAITDENYIFATVTN